MRASLTHSLGFIYSYWRVLGFQSFQHSNRSRVFPNGGFINILQIPYQLSDFIASIGLLELILLTRIFYLFYCVIFYNKGINNPFYGSILFLLVSSLLFMCYL